MIPWFFNTFWARHIRLFLSMLFPLEWAFQTAEGVHDSSDEGGSRQRPYKHHVSQKKNDSAGRMNVQPSKNLSNRRTRIEMLGKPSQSNRATTNKNQTTKQYTIRQLAEMIHKRGGLKTMEESFFVLIEKDGTRHDVFIESSFVDSWGRESNSKPNSYDMYTDFQVRYRTRNDGMPHEVYDQLRGDNGLYLGNEKQFPKFESGHEGGSRRKLRKTRRNAKRNN
jgi:hypothetical protein